MAVSWVAKMSDMGEGYGARPAPRDDSVLLATLHKTGWRPVDLLEMVSSSADLPRTVMRGAGSRERATAPIADSVACAEEVVPGTDHPDLDAHHPGSLAFRNQRSPGTQATARLRPGTPAVHLSSLTRTMWWRA